MIGYGSGGHVHQFHLPVGNAAGEDEMSAASGANLGESVRFVRIVSMNDYPFGEAVQSDAFIDLEVGRTR